jgi:hypothetical protein
MLIEVTETAGSNGQVEQVCVERPAEVGDLVFGDGIHGTGTLCEFAAVMSSQVGAVCCVCVSFRFPPVDSSTSSTLHGATRYYPCSLLGGDSFNAVPYPARW